MTYAICLDNVSKRYQLGVFGAGSLRSALTHWRSGRKTSHQELWALKDVSLAVGAGESVGLVGPNGAGKSTMLRLIAGISQPTEGAVDVRGRLASLLELGAGFHPELTGRENVYLYGSILGMKTPEINKVFDEIVAFSELPRFLDTPVKRYSSGMYVRLAFSVAAHVNPDILLVDEVLAVGDAAFRQKCIDRFDAMLANGATLLFVSHSAHMVTRVCKRAVYIQKGQVQLDGPAEEVMRAYEHDLRRATSRRSKQDSTEASSDDGIVEITDIQVVDLDGALRDAFTYSEGAQIRVRYAAQTRLDSLILHTRLFRDDDVACFTVRSNQPNAFLQDVSLDGEGSFALQLQSLQLYGGTYRVQVAIADTNSVLAAGYSPWFQVDGPGNIDIANERLGVYVPAATWQLGN